MASSSRPNVPARLRYPRASQPEVIRAHQKDAYYCDQFREQLRDVASDIIGSRRSHKYGELLSLLASVAYFGLSTLGSSQSLGEEYVNAMMRRRSTGRIVGAKRRVAYIVFYVIAPYALSRLYGLLRKFVVRKGEALAQREQRQLVLRHVRQERGEPVPPMEPDTYYRAAIRWLAANLPGSHVLSASDGWVAYAYAAQLALFYLGGRYYTIAHRLADVDYVHAVAKRPNMRPQSYEILGMLLVFQLLVKFGLSARTWLKQRAGDQQVTNKSLESSEKQGQTVRIDDAIYSHAESPAAKLPSQEPPAAVPLAYADPDTTATPEQLGIPTPSGAADAESLEIAQAASRARGSQLEAIAEDVLRCTLCMDRRTPERGNSALTECGHVFCWDCITGWAREKPECPLCRQSLPLYRILPVYNL